MKSFYESFASSAAGAKLLSRERLQYTVLKLLHSALRRRGVSQSALAERLQIRKSAVNAVLRGDGNVRIATLADYLNALDFEVQLELVPAGQPRAKALEDMNRVSGRKHLALVASPTRDVPKSIDWGHPVASASRRVVAARPASERSGQ